MSIKPAAAQTGSSPMLRAVREADRGEAGALSIGLTPSAACSPLADALYRYRIDHSRIELDLREMNSNMMESALRLRSIDVALMRPTSMDADITSVTIFEEPMLLAVRRDHPLAGEARVTIDQAADIPLIGYVQATSPYFRQMLQTMFASAGRRPRFVQESVVPTLLTLVQAGVGAAIVPWTISRSRNDSLAFIPLADPSRQVARIVISSLRVQPNVAVEQFITVMHRQAARLAKEKAPGEIRTS